MHDDPALLNVEYPILDNSGPRVQFGLSRKIETQCGIGAFDDQANVRGPRIYIADFGRGLRQHN